MNRRVRISSEFQLSDSHNYIIRNRAIRVNLL